LYRPSESALDVTLPLAPDADGTQTISTAKLARGLWRVKVTWSSEGREFYHEFKLQV
jgi:nitrogen fixation protein FixH